MKITKEEIVAAIAAMYLKDKPVKKAKKVSVKSSARPSQSLAMKKVWAKRKRIKNRVPPVVENKKSASPAGVETVVS